MLPDTLKDFNLFLNGNNYQGLVPELTLPTLTRTVESYRAGGMDGSVEIDLGQEPLEFAWKLSGMRPEAFADYGAPTHAAALLRFAGSYESDETGAGIAVEILVRGRHKEIGLGDAKPGELNQLEFTTAATYFKLTIAGAEALEIDTVGNVFRVNGNDRLAERRARLGL